MMDYSRDCCRSAVSRAAVRGYDSSKLECEFVCVCVHMIGVRSQSDHFKLMLGEEIALTGAMGFKLVSQMT